MVGNEVVRLEDYLAVTDEDADRRFKGKSVEVKATGGSPPAKKKRKKFTMKKVLDSSSFDKMAPGKANWGNIEVGPSIAPKKKYSDISGLEATYTDPKTKLRYATVEEYKQLKNMSHEVVQATLSLRGANVVIR